VSLYGNSVRNLTRLQRLERWIDTLAAQGARATVPTGDLNLGASHAKLKRPSPATPIVYGASAGSVESA
jgi:hypothetical protein